jgi:hypothetical protein
MQTAADQQAVGVLRLASDAKKQGQGFLELQLQVGTSQQKTNVWATDVDAGQYVHASHQQATSHAGLLSAVEQIGWHLEHVTYLFTPTHQKTHKAFLGGENAAISGVVMGIYYSEWSTPSSASFGWRQEAGGEGASPQSRWAWPGGVVTMADV